MSARPAIALALTLALALVIGYMTLVPIPLPLPEQMGRNDKLHHVLAFAVLAFPIAALHPRWLPGLALALAFYGGLIEIVQPYVGRSRDLADWLADLGGIFAGGGLGLVAGGLGRRLGRWLPAAQ